MKRSANLGDDSFMATNVLILSADTF
ncbi:hypothetical protein I315_05551 [Cryptococcus gattii Ru294]|uniref:Uncharacterized protein n=2 Tax=Cryptococcus gattii TaxID=37769 RepID=E6R8X6_CRYGW|nr:Hypothetical Protein CGB_G0500W [Cryptococcus gattii WM276]KIR51914.1 hypothetical protein I315_05551 [Cryptococcus gattii Ru294]KIR77843.1 hypothetical protein I306_05078 [Cryptococcus gattii EJB2]KIY31926.1 hypothetical protein I305_05561 [Cryptococcus gattii E566]KJE03192.1 hypothetical protein I311_03012 [Cryptococcus gattii NT-10]ADV23252.1 Hypothetical Protein CGB_G0500W [Cryptococcus gattii WM276]